MARDQNTVTTYRDALEADLAWYEDLADKASKAESYTAAVKARTEAGKVRAEIRQLDVIRRAVVVPEDPAERAAFMLDRCRRMQVAAETSGSYVAAERLIKLETELVAAEEARLKGLEKPDERTLDELLDELQRRLDELPDAIKVPLDLPVS